MEEPTVLDLFKSIFKDWKSFWNFIRSLFDEARRTELNRKLSQEAAAPEVAPAPAPQPAPKSGSKPFPWRSLLGLLAALLAQVSLEPPGRRVESALGLYAVAFALVIWAVVRDEWNLPSLTAVEIRSDPQTARFLPLIIAIPIAVAAFLEFSGNLFTFSNLTLWLVALGLFMFGLWLPRRRRPGAPKSPESRRRDFLWALLVLAAFGVVVFFRAYHIAQTPAEPFSDHAEKLLDVYDVSQGLTHIFFPRNTGREAIQMYWTLLMSWIFGTGLSFLSLKIGTVLLGILTLPYEYLLGKELGGKRLGLLAMFLFGIAYWPNLISRIGLRFPLYPLFVAPTFYYLFRGLRSHNRNDFILSGLFLGIGLHGYSPFRIVPLVVVVIFGIYLLHNRSMAALRRVAMWLVIVILISVVVFLPLMRYATENPGMFSYRAMTRLEPIDQPMPGSFSQIFSSNVWKGLLMFNWDDGDIWVNSVPHRPALGVVSGALFLIGILLLLARYLKKRHWLDLTLLVSVPLLQLPSTLSIIYPQENPAINRAGGAAVVVFLIVALALDGLLTTIQAGMSRRFGMAAVLGLTGILLLWSGWQNYDLVLNQFDREFRLGSWNSSEMGAVIKDFETKFGETDTVWIVPYPYWVDTRLPGVWAGIPNRDFAIQHDKIASTVSIPGPKLFIFWREDQDTQALLPKLYPQGQLRRYVSATPNHDFYIFFVPPQ